MQINFVFFDKQATVLEINSGFRKSQHFRVISFTASEEFLVSDSLSLLFIYIFSKTQNIISFK